MRQAPLPRRRLLPEIISRRLPHGLSLNFFKQKNTPLNRNKIGLLKFHFVLRFPAFRIIFLFEVRVRLCGSGENDGHWVFTGMRKRKSRAPCSNIGIDVHMIIVWVT